MNLEHEPVKKGSNTLVNEDPYLHGLTDVWATLSSQGPSRYLSSSSLRFSGLECLTADSILMYNVKGQKKFCQFEFLKREHPLYPCPIFTPKLLPLILVK